MTDEPPVVSDSGGRIQVHVWYLALSYSFVYVCCINTGFSTVSAFITVQRGSGNPSMSDNVSVVHTCTHVYVLCICMVTGGIKFLFACMPYSWKFGGELHKFGSLVVNLHNWQIKIWQYFKLHILVYIYIRWVARFKSTNIFAMAIWDLITKSGDLGTWPCKL